MLTAMRKKVLVQPDGKLEISLSNLPPGSEAEVIILVESTPESETERQARVARLKNLFEETQSLPGMETISEREIAEEVARYRTEKA